MNIRIDFSSGNIRHYDNVLKVEFTGTGWLIEFTDSTPDYFWSEDYISKIVLTRKKVSWLIRKICYSINMTTIDELIAKLESAKKIIGGDAGVAFWNNFDCYYVVSPEAIQCYLDKQISNVSCDNGRYVSLELNRVDYET